MIMFNTNTGDYTFAGVHARLASLEAQGDVEGNRQ